jgi:4-hydroxybenzoate polyprenyltransferase
MRPHQWVKNTFVLAPLVFAKELFHLDMALRALGAFGLFCLASSAVYIFNDLADVEADREHPVKRHRPIASGKLSEGAARGAMFAFALIAGGGGLFLEPAFGATAMGYLLLNILYSKVLKRIAYVDVLCITTGFELRVLGGAFAAEVPASAYLLVATFLLATYLGFGKRMHELMQGDGASKQRSVLAAYGERTLTIAMWATAIATIVTYAIYTLDPATRASFGTDYLIVTIPMPVFGVLRFLHLVRRQHTAESPTEDMLRDRPFLVNIIAWVIAVLAVIYVG